MIPVTQTEFGAKHGNCYAACIASIFELPIESLPSVPTDDTVVVEKYKTDSNKDNWDVNNFYDAWWWDMWNAWFEANNLLRYRVDYNKFTPRYTEHPAGYTILIGASPRNPNKVKHAVVAFNGKLVHDPHPDHSGLMSMEEFEIIVPKNFAVLFH